MHDILSRFLAAGLLPIGEDDEKLKLLEDAAVEITAQIIAKPLLAYRLTLIGLDDRITGTDPALKKAEEVVLSKWHTITNKIGASPVQVYRAVILRALELAVEEKPSLNHAVCLIAQNETMPYSMGKERQAIDAMLEQFDGDSAEELTEVWVNPVGLSFPKLAGKIKKAQINKEELAAAIARAAGPNDKDGKVLTNANPHWPNSGEPWSKEFVGRATEAIYVAIQSASKGFAEEMQEALSEIVQGLLKGIERLAVRDAKSELLWIRTSMYSPSARGSYKELTPINLVFHAALDVSRAVACIAPPSVEYFLRDLVASLTKKKLELSEVLTAIGPKLTALPEAQTILNDPLPASGRRTWLDVAVRANGAANFEEHTGVSNAHEESAGELAVKFYRELQIRKLLSVDR